MSKTCTAIGHKTSEATDLEWRMEQAAGELAEPRKVEVLMCILNKVMLREQSTKQNVESAATTII